MTSDRKTYLNRTPGYAGNTSTWTLSFWAKRTAKDKSQPILVAQGERREQDGTLRDNYERLIFSDDNKLQFLRTPYVFQLESTKTFTDLKWHHIQVVFNTLEASENDRIKFYVDGERDTIIFLQGNASSITLGSADYNINSDVEHRIGRWFSSYDYYGDQYMSDVYLVDGQALEPEVFGKSFEGRWGPLDSSDV